MGLCRIDSAGWAGSMCSSLGWSLTALMYLCCKDLSFRGYLLGVVEGLVLQLPAFQDIVPD